MSALIALTLRRPAPLQGLSRESEYCNATLRQLIILYILEKSNENQLNMDFIATEAPKVTI